MYFFWADMPRRHQLRRSHVHKRFNGHFPVEPELASHTTSLLPHLRDADLPYSQFWRSLKTILFGYWYHGAVWTILTVPSRNNLTYLLTYLPQRSLIILCRIGIWGIFTGLSWHMINIVNVNDNVFSYSNYHYFQFLDGIAFSDVAYCNRCYVAWSFRPYVCHLSHSCTILKPPDGMRCHLAGTLVWSQVTLC